MIEDYKDLVGREFRHFKGNLYRLEGFAKDSETLEEMVVYRALGPLRPLRGSGGRCAARASPSGNPTPSARANLMANMDSGCAPQRCSSRRSNATASA